MSLRARSVGVTQGGKVLLQGLSVELPEKSLVALVGPNGAGKSTLIRCLAGALIPTEGRVELDGDDIGAVPGETRSRKLSYLPQILEAPFAFTVAELLSLNGRGFDKAHPILSVLEMYELLEKPLTQLSGGERQRAAVTRALLAEVPFILLDEPLTHLDPRYAIYLLRYLSGQADRGKKIVVVLHDLRLARQFATHIWLMMSGKLLFDGAEDELRNELLSEAFGLNDKDLLMFS